MSNKKTIYRTVITMVVLSEEPIPEHMTLDDINYECDEGSYIGGAMDRTTTELVGKVAVNEITKAGSDPEFFQMDSEGYSLENDEENAVVVDVELFN